MDTTIIPFPYLLRYELKELTSMLDDNIAMLKLVNKLKDIYNGEYIFDNKTLDEYVKYYSTQANLIESAITRLTSKTK